MKSGFRQTIAVLHTWVGLVAGWVLMAIFVGGTLSVFAHPISEWMRQEPIRSVAMLPASERPLAVATAARFLSGLEPDQWRIALPDETDSALRVWTDAAGSEEASATRLDAESGALLAEHEHADEDPPRPSEGGSFFVGLHFSLHAGVFGTYLAGLTTLAMLLALVTGVIVHKRIFVDVFTLRFGKGQRSWLDGHNVAAVLTLPFQFMIGLSGLTIFHALWMPAAIWSQFGALTPRQSMDREGSYFDATAARYEAMTQPFVGLIGGKQLAYSALPSIVSHAQEVTGRPVIWLSTDADEQGNARLRLAVRGDPLVGLPAPEERVYAVRDASGRLEPEESASPSAPDATAEGLAELHMLGFGGAAAHWLWFLCGIAGCAMIATGLVLFTVKRRERVFGALGPSASSLYRMIESLNVAAVAGLTLASIAFLWINRIIPAHVPGRVEHEANGFFAVWVLSLLYALWRQRRAWPDLFGLTALLCLLLPLLNLLTTGDWLATYFARGESSLGAVEVTALALGAAFATISWRARHAAQRANKGRV